jgi:hypothetical protein
MTADNATAPATLDERTASRKLLHGLISSIAPRSGSALGSL